MNSGRRTGADAGAGLPQSPSVSSSSTPAKTAKDVEKKPGDSNSEDVGTVQKTSVDSKSEDAKTQISNAATIVQQLWQRQVNLASTQKQEFEAKCAGLRQMITGQNKGVLQGLQTCAGKAGADVQADLQQIQMQIPIAHKSIQEALADLSNSHGLAQSALLQQTKGQLGGLLRMLQTQDAQLQQSQQQITQLQTFAGEASKVLRQTQSASTSQRDELLKQLDTVKQQWAQEKAVHAVVAQQRDADVAKCVAEVKRLTEMIVRDRAAKQVELAAKTDENMLLRERIQCLESEKSSETSDTKARLALLEEELVKVLKGDVSDGDEEWV